MASGHQLRGWARRLRRRARSSRQVGLLDFRGFERIAYNEGTRRARGELGYPKPGEVVIGNLHGAPISEHFLSYSPADAMSLAPDCPIEIVLAGNEELFDMRIPTKPATNSDLKAASGSEVKPDAVPR